jgi:dihydrolipoamide dehydrogenase
MLIQAANAVNGVRDAGTFHVDATLEGVDHAAVVDEMDDLLGGIAEGMEGRYREKEHLTLFKQRTRFVDERTVELDGEAVSAEKVVVAAGSRPIVPPIDGLADVDYLTSQDALYRRELPESLVILGGGYIAVELGYFFEAMGTDVTMVEMMDSLVPREDDDIAASFTEIAADRHDVYTGHRVTAVEEGEGGHAVHAESESGDELTVEG